MKVKEERRSQIICVEPCCRGVYGTVPMVQLLKVHGCDGDADRLLDLAAEHAAENLVFCPIAGCSGVGEAPLRCTKVECSECNQTFCAQCRVPWKFHDGLDCDAFQALPAAERGLDSTQRKTEASLKEQCRQCPRCKVWISKTEDTCNFVSCPIATCDASFCYKCGAQYVSLVATEENSHGVPGCSCGLWAAADQEEGEAPPAARWRHPQQQLRWRQPPRRHQMWQDQLPHQRQRLRPAPAVEAFVAAPAAAGTSTLSDALCLIVAGLCITVIVLWPTEDEVKDIIGRISGRS